MTPEQATWERVQEAPLTQDWPIRSDKVPLED